MLKPHCTHILYHNEPFFDQQQKQGCLCYISFYDFFSCTCLFYILDYGPAHTLYLSPDNLFVFSIESQKLWIFFKKQELPAKRVSDTEDLLKDIKTSFLCHLINMVLNSDLFSIAIYFSSYQHLTLPPVGSIIKEKC